MAGPRCHIWALFGVYEGTDLTAPLSHLLEAFERDPAFRDVAYGGGDGVAVPDAARPYFCAALAKTLERCILAVVPTEAEAEALHAATSEFLQPVALLRGWDVLPYEGLAPDPRISAQRIEALRLLARGSGPRVVVASARAFIQKPAPAVTQLEPLHVTTGATHDRDELAHALVERGYERTDIASEPGTFAVRGGIVDVFAAHNERPSRIELDGDEVSSIRWIDQTTQRSLGSGGQDSAPPNPPTGSGGQGSAPPNPPTGSGGQDSAPPNPPTGSGGRNSPPNFSERPVGLEIIPRSELALTEEIRNRARAAADLVTDEQTATGLGSIAQGATPEGAESLIPHVWDHDTDGLHTLTAHNCLVCLIDPKRITDETERTVEQEEELASLWTDPARPPDEITERPARQRIETSVIHLALDGVLDDIRGAGTEVWSMPSFVASPDDAHLDLRAWDVTTARGVLERSRALKADGYEVVFCALPNETAAVATRLKEEELETSPVIASRLHGGFISPPLKLALVTHTEWHARPPPPARRKRPKKQVLGELGAGDLVVHAQHGVGRYCGMETREVAGFVREYLVIEYAAADRLFVPTETTDSLQRYIGSEQPSLSRLGTADWERTKARVRKKVRDIAADLIRLYSARLKAPGHSYPIDTPWERELAESFPFDETPDQLAAIEDVGRDMHREIPMDRLVCGDVGYGKTEVAVRAAFKAVVEGKQVAVLVPTTLLAQQHFATFSERLKPYAVKVAMLSRFVDAKAQAEIVAGLQTGEIDIVIGTHRLLSKDLAWSDLGLLVLDEEHRFGVAQKEKLRRMRVDVDVLTLTATPIPRTLEMSLSGIRDLSIIDTAPADRHPVRTFVGPFDERLLVAAVRRELGRGGQVFVVHNRVRSIGRERRRLERLVPEARIAVAHGQMDEDRLEQTMVDFLERRFDILLCTTIIEAGLDIPTVNTLIVDRADMLGLAQLYQLRGRVGRAGEQAYAYLFYPAHMRMTPTAHERLKTLAQHSDLGAGMAIAMRDLEIRGAGNMLGAEQHGHIEAVGFEMYTKLLEEAAKELRGEKVSSPPDVRIDLPVDAYLPTSYIDREPLRLAAYRRVAEAVTSQDVADARAELADRYGPLPAPARSLLELADLRAELRAAGVTDVSLAPHELYGRVARLRGVALDDPQLQDLRADFPGTMTVEATQTLLVPLPDEGEVDLILWLHEVVQLIQGVSDRVPAGS